ncbi:MAG: hypothetical protein IPK26_27355 [Planctomycetes bacterium]|nr:hypothetical protein [Planctomycetota bacterium]
MNTKLAAALSLLSCATVVCQIPPSWALAATTGPGARQFHSMVYDSQRQRAMLFGGHNNYADTWHWDGTSWTLLAATGPLARHSHGMAFDSRRGRTVLFGGERSLSIYLGDTWEWTGSAWQPQLLAAGPVPRRNHAMAYDSQRGRTLLFGGYGSGGFLNDTWEWSGTTWAQLATTGPASRFGHAMVYDSHRQRTVVFGGILANYSGDSWTWEWDGTSWAAAAFSGPPARMNHAMVYDNHRQRTVLFGGSAATPFGDTWEWDGTSWTRTASTGPSARSTHAMAYDSHRQRTVLFGGTTNVVLGDTWEWNGYWTSIAVAFGSGCGRPALALSPVANGRPSINTTAQVSLTNIPASLAFVALGWSRTVLGAFSLPLSLSGFGMPGCDLLQSADVAALPLSSNGPGAATYSLFIPNSTAYIGLHVYLQGWAVSPGANPSDTIVINGVKWALGNS